MVQELSPKLNLGGAIGAGLSSGLNNIAGMYAQRNMQRDQQQYQRSLLQNGLDEAYQAMSPEMQAQFQPTLQVLKAFSGVPGNDRALSSILPTLQSSALANRLAQSRGMPVGQGMQGGQGVQGGQGMQMPQQGGMPMQARPQQAPAQQPGTIPNVGKFSDEAPSMQDSSSSALFPRIRSPDEMNALAEAEFIASNGTRSKEAAYNQLALQNQVAEDRWKQIEQRAQKAGVPEGKIPEFMELARRDFGEEPNVNALINKALPRWKQQQQAERALLSARPPRPFASVEERQKSLSRIGPLVRDAAKFGKEQWAKEVLTNDFGATPLEIERELRKDYLPEMQKQVKSAPQGPLDMKAIAEQRKFLDKEFGSGYYLPGFSKSKGAKPEISDSQYFDAIQKSNPDLVEKSNDSAAKWIANTVTDKDSLLVLRDLLMKEKGYNWQQFGEIYEKARKLGWEPTASQRAETGEFTSRPPRGTLEDIMGDWTQVGNYLFGGE